MGYYKRSTKVKPAPVPEVAREWSHYQQEVFQDIASGEGNTHVSALPGSGKTSVIVEGFKHVPNNKSALMCAFNKSIRDELESRAPSFVSAKTLHQVGYAACRKAFPRLGKPDQYKLEGYVKAERGEESESFDIRGQLEKTVNLCKCYLVTEEEQISALIDKHDIDMGSDTRSQFIHSAQKILFASTKDTARVDFADMCWFPNHYNLDLEKYDRVFIDEAQDLNASQINLALNSCASGGRILSVGDVYQSIYSFSGADSEAIPNIINRMNSRVLPLSITYRCAKSIVTLAQTLVPQLEAAPGAKEGLVSEIKQEEMADLVKPGDFILSRSNAPLIRWCLNLLKSGIPANIQGRDLGKGFLFLMKKSGAQNVDSFLDYLNDYLDVEVERLTKLRRDTSLIQDKVDCLRSLCEGTRSLDQVKDNIQKLFRDGDEKDRVILSSTHRAKGLERDRVFMLNSTYKPGKNQEETNLAFVAMTRAKNELYLVSGK